MDPLLERQYLVNRREFFGKSATGIGVAALASLLGEESCAAGSGEIPRALSHFAPKAKRVIVLFQNGAPSHLELFDHKPQLAAMHGQPVPASYMAGKRFSTMSAAAEQRKLLAPSSPSSSTGRAGRG